MLVESGHYEIMTTLLLLSCNFFSEFSQRVVFSTSRRMVGRETCVQS